MQSTKNDLPMTEHRTAHRWLSAARCGGRKDGYAGKRRHPRFTWSVHVSVTEMDPGAQPREQFGVTRDISAGGIGIRVRRHIATAARVRVTHHDSGEAVHGRVRFCVEALGGYFVGVEFTHAASPDPASASARATRRPPTFARPLRIPASPRTDTCTANSRTTAPRIEKARSVP